MIMIMIMKQTAKIPPQVSVGGTSVWKTCSGFDPAYPIHWKDAFPPRATLGTASGCMIATVSPVNLSGESTSEQLVAVRASMLQI